MRRRRFRAGLLPRGAVVAVTAVVAATGAVAIPAGIARAADTDTITSKASPKLIAADAGNVKSALASMRDLASRAPAPLTEPAGAMDAVFSDPSPLPGEALTLLDPSDWIPEHALKGAPKAVDPAVAPAAAPTSHADKEIDPEPDAAIKAPAEAPSKDPLDRPKPLAAPSPAAALARGTPAAQAAAPSSPSKTAEDALPPLNAALKALLDQRAATDLKGPRTAELRKERDAVAFFYAAHGFAPAWSENGRAVAAADPVLGRLARASEDALSLTGTPTSLRVDGRVEDVAASDLALTEAVVTYARQATGSRIDPYAISPLIGARRDLADPAEVVDSLIAAGAAAGDKLQQLNPPEPRYAALRQKLAELRAARIPAGAARIPPGPTLRIGMRDPRVPLIRSRLSLGATPDGAADDQSYDTALAAAVADFQRANGLPPSGTLNKRTIVALSGGEPSRLEATLVANMEMWRWMPRDLGADRIEVNIPEYEVTVFHDGVRVATNRVVVGKTTTPTPLFSNTMKYLIVNPVWNVPESIVRKEFIPKSDGDPDYLASHGFDVSYRNGQLVVKQPSGAKNALGRIKFMFPNDYSVYLHDTPSKSLFASAKRAFSHGCVRVDQPFAFAESVLNDAVPEGGEIKWSQKRLQKMLGDKERYVYLPQALPIHIGYFTALVDPESGQLRLHEDIYDYARRVAVALGQDG